MGFSPPATLAPCKLVMRESMMPKREPTKPKKNRRIGRPPRSMPPRVDASPEEIARVVLNVKPPEKWRYMKRRGTKLRGKAD